MSNDTKLMESVLEFLECEERNNKRRVQSTPSIARAVGLDTAATHRLLEKMHGHGLVHQFKSFGRAGGMKWWERVEGSVP